MGCRWCGVVTRRCSLVFFKIMTVFWCVVRTAYLTCFWADLCIFSFIWSETVETAMSFSSLFAFRGTGLVVCVFVNDLQRLCRRCVMICWLTCVRMLPSGCSACVALVVAVFHQFFENVSLFCVRAPVTILVLALVAWLCYSHYLARRSELMSPSHRQACSVPRAERVESRVTSAGTACSGLLRQHSVKIFCIIQLAAVMALVSFAVSLSRIALGVRLWMTVMGLETLVIVA